MNRSHRQFLKFLLTGVVNTLFGYGVFALLIFLKVHYALASFAATSLGVAFNFHTIGRFVFGNRDQALIFKFFAVYGVVYLLSVGGLKALSAIGVSYYLGGGLLLLPMAIISFVLNRKFVFNKPGGSGTL